jgi:hypothetical protein
MVNKNLIYVTSIDSETSKFKDSEYAQYCIKTWEHYCKRHNIDLKVLTEDRLKTKYPIWNKELVCQYGEGYDKIGVVDSDTMVRWDAPNIFEFTDPAKFYGVNDLCDLNWLLDSVKQRQKFFPDVKLDLMKYLNAGVLFFGAEHLFILYKFLIFVLTREEEINAIKGGGKEQTLLNFFLQKNNVEIETLHPEWNLLSIHRKNMFTGNWQLKIDPLPYFLKYAYVWHFTGFPIEDRINVMKQTWDLIKQNYE